MTRPVFLLASERSGTNLLRRRLTESQDVIFGPAPLHFLKHMHYATPYYGNLKDNDNFFRFIQDGLGLAHHHFSPWGVDFQPSEIIEAYPTLVGGKRSSVGVMHAMYTLYAKSKGYSTYFCKDNHLFNFVNDIRLAIPGARFVYLHRDPRDVILSQKKRPSQNHGVAYLSRLWQDEQIKCILCMSALTKVDEFLKISYEDFVEDEDGILRRLAAFLGLEMSGGLKGALGSERRDIHEWENLDSPTIQNNVGKFKHGLSVSAVRKIEGICWPQMCWLGYKPVNDSRPVYSKMRQAVEVAISSLERQVRSRIGNNRMTPGQIDRARYARGLQRKWR